MRNVVVTGVSRGIGRGIAEKLATDGWTVHGTYKASKKEAEDFAANHKAHVYQVDFTVRKQTQEFVKRLGGIPLDGLVCNAGIIEFENPDDFDFGIWDRTMEVNVTTPLVLAHGFRKQLKPGSGIVNIASTDGMTGSFSSASYAASKAALINLTKSLGNVMARHGIRVNAVAPGWINTGMSTEASYEAAKLAPAGRNGLPKDVAEVVSFLLSEKAAFVTGTSIVVDGGYTNVDYIMKKEAGL